MWGCEYFFSRHFTAEYFFATGGSIAAEVISNLSKTELEQIRFKMGTPI